jgi:hypothetical protein
MKRHIQLYSILLLTAFLFSCEDAEDANNENEHEAITTVAVYLNKTGTPTDTIYFDDPDGDGGNSPLLTDTIELDTQSIYSVSLRFFNKTKNPTSDVTPTIQAQSTSHEVFILPANGEFTVTRTDKDAVGFPFGLASVWQTGNIPQQGFVRIKLMHKPVIKGPNDSPDKGHSDVDVIFPLRVR